MCVTTVQPRLYSTFRIGFDFRVEADKWVALEEGMPQLTRLPHQLAEELLVAARKLTQELELGKTFHLSLTSNGVFSISSKNLYGKVEFIAHVNTEILLQINWATHTLERIN